MNFEQNTSGGIPKDCIDDCRGQLESDPDGQAIWVFEENHAYFIGHQDKPKKKLQGVLPYSIMISGQVFQIEHRTVKELRELIKKGKAINITGLIKRA